MRIYLGLFLVIFSFFIGGFGAAIGNAAFAIFLFLLSTIIGVILIIKGDDDINKKISEEINNQKIKSLYAEKKIVIDRYENEKLLEIFNAEKEIFLQISPDFEKKMNWNEATSECAKLDNGWRLPTREELNLICRTFHKNGIGNFKNDFYWSKTLSITKYPNDSAWVTSFHSSNNSFSSDLIMEKNHYLYVRAVRSFNLKCLKCGSYNNVRNWSTSGKFCSVKCKKEFTA